MLEFLRNMFSMQRNRNERGASAVEYGLLVGGIAALIVVLVFALGNNVTGLFKDTCTKVAAGSTTDSASTACP
ncbi:Flp family type IVb pilin [Nocardioides sp.]|uniref:Flp family type IVb pilin n=1 Tax=Nocardioides sp. TaxID=35761 RepID=UPI0025F93B0C|nr:Flp family type IVb pilin [Nocardioides sp.]